MFIGREKELKTLNGLYASDQFEFVVIYGRRRVGKTALINEFVKEKKAIYFMGVESNAKQNLENFSKSIFEYVGGMDADTTFSSYQSALEYAFRLSEKERLVVAIDEYPYVARGSKSFASTLQLLIDQYKATSKMMLILCGSSMSYMEDHVLAYKAPLYGRRTAQIKLQPFSFEETCRLFQSFSNEDKALLYGLYGGTPQYLLQVKENLSVEENIKNTFLNSSSAIYEEPINLIKQEVREPAIYTAIISAIASGATKMSEICTKVGEDTSTVSVYLKNLVMLGIVEKESPYGESNSKKAIYSILDNLFRFWYRFIPQNSSIIARGASDLAYKRIESEISDYMGSVFEEIAKQYLWKCLIDGTCPIDFCDLGRWWGTNPKTRKQEEIDIMGTDKNSALFAECKWTNEKVDLSVLETLVERSKLFHFTKIHFYLFAKNGFTKGCLEKGNEMGNVTFVTYDEIVNQ